MKHIRRILDACRSNALAAFAVALISFAAGSLATARLMRNQAVSAGSHRVFELRVYHAVPGKVDKLEARFRNVVTPLFAKHDLRPIGFWVPEDAPASGNTFIYILAHESREAAKKNWDAMRADPGFDVIVKDEAQEKLVEGVDSTYMDPTDFSPMK
jgi:hypothetical protein